METGTSEELYGSPRHPYTIKLREGVSLHNGDAFDAEDVLFTLNRSSDPEQSTNSRVIANVASLENLNDLEVQFTLKQPQASFLTKALQGASGRAMTLVSRGAIEQLGLSPLRPDARGHGSLPYRRWISLAVR